MSCPGASSLWALLHFMLRCTLRHQECPWGLTGQSLQTLLRLGRLCSLEILLPAFGSVLCFFLFLLKLTRRDKVQK